MNIEIPNVIISFAFVSAAHKVLDCDGLIDTDDDTRGVKDKEHDDSNYEYVGQVAVLLLLFHTISSSFCTWIF